MYFSFEKIPNEVVLARGQAVWSVATRNFVGEGSITIETRPTPSVIVICRFEGLSHEERTLLVLSDDVEDQRLSINSQDIPGFQLSLESDETAVLLLWAPSTLPIRVERQATRPAVRIAFHLFSFHHLHRLKSGCLTLADDDWVIKLNQLPDIAEIKKKISRDGVCRVTHVGELSRKDGQSFSRGAAEEQLHLFRYFMGIVRGTWCDPVCAIGFDRDGNVSWESYAAPKFVSEAISSWFDYVHPEQMQSFFPLFSMKWNSTTQWRTCLREVIYWYINANTAGGIPGIDISILLSQAALERLAFETSSRDLEQRSQSPSRKTKASEQIRSLLSFIQIPTEIPSTLPNLRSIASRMGWEDGPHALTSVRNSLIHPKKDEHLERAEAITDGWKLGLWYLELALLGVCGYDSTYGNRLSRTMYGQVTTVPWQEKNVSNS